MKQRQPNTFIQFFSSLLIVVGSLTLSVFFLTSWAHSLIFDTNYYLGVVTPLPQNATVAKAISTYTINTFFEKGNIEEKIRNALPEQAKFLASTLTDNLQNRSYQRTTQIIQSDQFSSLWVAANTIFHQRILNVVRGGGIFSKLNGTQSLQSTSLQFDGSQLAQTIKNQLGSDSQLINNDQVKRFKHVTVPIFTKLHTIRQIVYWITELASMLLPVSLALILYGVAISFTRQKAFLISGIIITLVMILTLLSMQIIKNDFLNQITQPTYISAATVVWDSFLGGLKMSLWLTILGGFVIITLALIAGPYQWAKNFQKAIGIPQLQRSGFMIGFTRLRILLARYALWLRLLGIIIAIIVLLVMQTITIATVVITLSWLLIYLAILSFIFPRN